jgi:Holliday junction resolvase RusA-like endonuclease
MGYKLTIEMPTAATDANKTNRGNKFAHSHTRQVIKKHIEHLCRNQKPEKPLEKFKIYINRFGPRRLDFDNCVSSLKAYIDGLVIAKVIKNDSWKYIQSIDIKQTVSQNEKKLVITVEET